MCEANRVNIEFFLILLFGLLCAYVAGVLQAEEPAPIPGGMPLSSQSSGPRLSSSGETLLTWENISGRFQAELTALRYNLLTALDDATQSKKYSESWMNLYGNSLRRIENLERYSSQLAERMQERDQDLAAAYDTIDEQKEKILEKDNTILKMGIAIGLLGLVIIAGIAIAILIFYGKLKLSWLKLLTP